VLVYDGFNQKVREDSGVIVPITRNVGADLKRNGQGVIESQEIEFRVRKLTEKECFRLMGVKDEDFEKIRKNQSKSSCYHLAGDSIVTTVLMSLFGEMLGNDWREKVNNLTEELNNGTSNSIGY
jgi:site-specific DNA-cytosine methylase